ncbi:type II secretion system GspH family protein [bacterium]|nr:type II secretion system GspH family protein [bacterium]
MIQKTARHSITIRIITSVLVGVTIFAVAYSLIIYFAFPTHQPASGFDNTLRIFPSFEVSAEATTAFALGALWLLWILHILVLVGIRRLTTHTIRDILAWFVMVPVVILYVGSFFAVVSEIISQPSNVAEFYSALALLIGLLTAILVVGLRMHPLLAFSIPSNWVSIIPLVISYLMLLNPYVLLAGMIFPSHRRLKEYWRPRPLPRFKKKKAMTLIELLIVIAILAILAPVTARVAAQARIVSERQELSRESVALIEDELALLRARPELPAPGTYAIDPQAARLHPDLAPLAKVEISETSGPLVQARVTVDLTAKNGMPVSLATLMAPRKEAQR